MGVFVTFSLGWWGRGEREWGGGGRSVFIFFIHCLIKTIVFLFKRLHAKAHAQSLFVFIVFFNLLLKYESNDP